MDVTLYRYRIEGATWSNETADSAFMERWKTEMMSLPFQGEGKEQQYGFAHCGIHEDTIYGLFVQKFPTILTDYDPETKKELKQDTVDSGEYLFVIFPKRYEIYFQSKRSSNLPDKEEVLKRFTAIMRLAVSRADSIMFNKLSETKDEIDREKIVQTFYKGSDKVLEMEFSDFDVGLIYEQKRKRGGKRQTYFNPREEYQEGMEEAALSLATNAETASIKAKKGGNLKKDPITRAMLEGSTKPTKIVYISENTQYTDTAVTRSKEIIYLEGKDFNLENGEQVRDIISRLLGQTEDKKRGGLKESEDQALF